MATKKSLKSIPVPMFNGMQKNFATFWIKMRAYGGMKGFQKALKPERELSLPATEDTEVEEDSEVYKARERNLVAMTYLTLAFTSEMNINMIAKAQTDEWPNGLAYLVVRELLRWYKPNDNISFLSVLHFSCCSCCCYYSFLGNCLRNVLACDICSTFCSKHPA